MPARPEGHCALPSHRYIGTGSHAPVVGVGVGEGVVYITIVESIVDQARAPAAIKTVVVGKLHKILVGPQTIQTGDKRVLRLRDIKA